MAVSEWCSEKTGWPRIGPRRRSASGRAPSPLAPPSTAPKASSTAGDVGRCGRLATRDPDVILVDEAEEHPTPAGSIDDRRRPAARLDDHGVEEVLVDEAEAGLPQPCRDVDGAAVDTACDAAQSLGAVVHGVHGGHDSQQHLGGADVGRRLLPADVLLPRLQGEAVGGPLLRVDRESDQAPRQIALQPRLDRHEGRMRTAVPERDPEALRGPDGDISSPLPRRLEQRQRQQVGGHGDQRALGVRLRGQCLEITNATPSTPDIAAQCRSSRRRAHRHPGRRRRA